MNYRGDYTSMDAGRQARDPTSVRKKDHENMTPLHLAAAAVNYEAVKALLALPAGVGVRQDLKDRGNAKGLTPVELCEETMERLRSFAVTLIGQWGGHEEKALRAAYLLKAAAGDIIWSNEEEAVMSGMSEQEKEHSYYVFCQYGCTCRACICGWLSPRMRFRLACK